MLGVLIAMIPWTKIAEIIFKILVKKYGPGLMKFAVSLIGDREEDLALKRIDSGLEAEKINIDILKEVTKQSPGLSTNDAKLINWAAYNKYINEFVKVKAASWKNKAARVREKSLNYSESDFMKLYKSQPDRAL